MPSPHLAAWSLVSITVCLHILGRPRAGRQVFCIPLCLSFAAQAPECSISSPASIYLLSSTWRLRSFWPCPHLYPFTLHAGPFPHRDYGEWAATLWEGPQKVADGRTKWQNRLLWWMFRAARHKEALRGLLTCSQWWQSWRDHGSSFQGEYPIACLLKKAQGQPS